MTERSYPALLRIEGTNCTVVGGGHVAFRKVNSLLDAGARVTVISPVLANGLAEYASNNIIIWKEKRFEADDLAGAVLVIAATDQPDVNVAVWEAVRPGQWITVADRPDLSTFIVPAQVRRGRLLLTISTEGASPGLSRRIARELAVQYDDTYDIYTEWLADSRKIVLKQIDNPVARRIIFAGLLTDEFWLIACNNDRSAWDAELTKLMCKAERIE
ncbi:precorrin-2 dehydrogenase [Aneurinibacillus soli]|uniref:precorrin-2 dehydrogenase n=1 Tax=Aneurinibacillus soli TaxID=1500254 RepID=A0A0U5B6Y3_9BACL|nr:bifunctional precorrin-2 dehydrogenase/sirohydrochlorin ferrochelatase [Aneurinibacillus soli]PYE59294.1 precorrin-2 dehydrogenase [Aneurinibacillus soli]BAU26716.1 Precorrin-2 dehydrogenase [Aneurinibacillus soli]